MLWRLPATGAAPMHPVHARVSSTALVVAPPFPHFAASAKAATGRAQSPKGTRMTISTRRQAATLARTLADLAEGGLADRIRLEQAARVIVAARRAATLAEAGALALPSVADPAVQAVTEIARHWDATAVTALEYAETLPQAALERLLRAAPRWAAAFAAAPDRLAA